MWLTFHLVVHFFNCLQLLELLTHYANTGKETLSPFIDSSMDNVVLQLCASRFLTLQTFLNFIW